MWVVYVVYYISSAIYARKALYIYIDDEDLIDSIIMYVNKKLEDMEDAVS